MQTVGRTKLVVYFHVSSGGSNSITVYDGLIKDAGVYAGLFYFSRQNPITLIFYKATMFP